MRSARLFHALALATAASVLAACEPVDTGGGGGVGGHLAFIRSGALVSSNDDGLGEQILTQNNTSAEPALSPNGQTVAFAFSATNDESARSIQIVPRTGGQLTALAEPPAGTTYGSPTWSRDGQTVYFTAVTGADSVVMRVSVAGGDASPVVPGQTDLHFPAVIDANRLLVSQGAGLALNVLDLTSGTLTPVGVSSPSRAAVSPDGTKIAYAKQDATTHIVVRALDGGAESELATTTFGDVKPSFAPDGTFVAFDAKGPNDAAPKIYAAKTDVSAGAGSTVFLQSGSDVSWSF